MSKQVVVPIAHFELSKVGLNGMREWASFSCKCCGGDFMISPPATAKIKMFCSARCKYDQVKKDTQLTWGKSYICSGCKKAFPRTDEYFYKNQASGIGLSWLCKKCHSKEGFVRASLPENAEKRRESTRLSSRKHRGKRRAWETRKLKEDAQYKLKKILRDRVVKLLKGKTKSAPTLELLGCTIEEFKAHLESKFVGGMNWSNHGKDGWHLDHIKPCAAFDLTDPQEQRECFHHTNFQPLWAFDNMSKSDKVNGRRISETRRQEVGGAV